MANQLLTDMYLSKESNQAWRHLFFIGGDQSETAIVIPQITYVKAVAKKPCIGGDAEVKPAWGFEIGLKSSPPKYTTYKTKKEAISDRNRLLVALEIMGAGKE